MELDQEVLEQGEQVEEVLVVVQVEEVLTLLEQLILEVEVEEIILGQDQQEDQESLLLEHQELQDYQQVQELIQ